MVLSAAACVACTPVGSEESVSGAAEAANEIHVFLLLGESGMIGRAPFDNGARHPANTLQWGRAGADDEHLIPATIPLHHHDGLDSGAMGPDIQFSIDWMATHPECGSIVFVPCAAAGSCFTKRDDKKGGLVSFWNPGDHLYVDAVARANACMRAVRTAYPDRQVALEAMLCHIGLNDIFYKNTAFRVQLDAMIAALRSDIEDAAETPFILGELPYDYPDVRQANADISDVPNRIPRSAAVSAAELKTFDGLHFDAPSLRKQGARYAEAYSKVAGKSPNGGALAH